MTPSPSRCVVVSALAHGALVALAFFAPGFSHQPPPEDPQVELRLVDVIPAKVVDSMFAGGGGTPKPPQTAPPKAPPLAPPVEPPPSKPEPPKPEPPKAEPPKVDPPKPEPPKPEPVKPEPHKVEVSKEPIKLPKTPNGELAAKDPKDLKKQANETAPTKSNSRKVEVAKAPVKPSAAELEAERAAKEQARHVREETERRQREFRDQIASVANAARSGASSLDRRLESTKIEMPSGPGGEAYVNYHSVLYSIYKPKWDRGRPDAVVENLVAVKAAVTILRNGSVVSSRIVQPSGIPAVDKAADRVLKSVSFVPPFPAESKDAERTFTINFTVEGRADL